MNKATIGKLTPVGSGYTVKRHGPSRINPSKGKKDADFEAASTIGAKGPKYNIGKPDNYGVKQNETLPRGAAR